MGRVTSEHHSYAESAFKNGNSTAAVQTTLKEEFGLTKSQANACCRTARKHLKIYKSIRKDIKERERKARKEAMEQAERQTEVDQDA